MVELDPSALARKALVLLGRRSTHLWSDFCQSWQKIRL